MLTIIQLTAIALVGGAIDVLHNTVHNAITVYDENGKEKSTKKEAN